MWHPYNGGSTIGAEGSENGTILKDEVWDSESRITLEHSGGSGYSITCGIFGLICHTAFSNSEEEAIEMLESMKRDIQEFLLKLISDELTDESISGWCDWFIDIY